MSKKKAFSGSTMTLRDFHGGSIPSDLPLPSAPGMTVERSSHDRPSSGGRMNRGFGSDRGGFLRQGSANMARSFEDKAFYFPNPANIGRNYDEDERKPVDGQSRRGAGVESFEEQLHSQSQASYVRPADRYSLENRGSYTSSKYDVGADSYAHEDFGLIPLGHSAKSPQDYHQAASMYAQDPLQSVIVSQEHSGYQPVQSSRPYSTQQPAEAVSPWRQGNIMSPKPNNSVAASSGAGVQNVWTARREGELNRSFSNEMSGNDAVGGARTQTVATRIAQASALEKVSSGRWNSRVPYSPVEHPQENTGEYSQVQRRQLGGSRVDVAGDNSIHARHQADLVSSVYSDNNTSSYSEYARAGYAESVRGLDTGSVRSNARSTSLQGSFSDNRYGELASKSFPEPTNEWADGSARYQEAGKISVRDYKAERHAEEVPVYSHGDNGRRGNFGPKDTSRPVVADVVSYPESGRPRSIRYGSSEAGTYGEPGNFTQSSSSLQVRGGYGDGRTVDGNKGTVSEHGRQGFGILEQGVNVDSGYGHHSHNDSLGLHRVEGARSSQTVFPYVSEEVSQQPYGNAPSREFFVRDSSKSPYVSESSKDVYANERNKGPAAGDFEGGRVQYPRAIRSNSSVNEMGTPSSVFPSAASMESEGKNLSVERPKLKLLPRSKPLEFESGNGFLQEDTENSQVDPETVQSINTELALGITSATAAANTSASPRPTEDGELTGRPKLNLKPRSQSSDVVPDSGSVKERMSVFGGARPRELVLKERGVDESLFAGMETAPSPGTFMSGNQRPTSGGNRYIEEPEHRGDRADEWRIDARRSELHDAGNGRQMARHDSGRLERNESRGRKESWFDSDKREDRRSLDSRQIQEKRDVERADVDKQDNWRHSTEFQSPSYGQSPAPLSGGIGGGELHSRGPGRIGIASAAELAQAFSRSTSLGSGTTRGYLATQTSPAPRTPGVGFGESSSRDSPKDARFSRLTETLSPATRDVYISGVQGSSRRMNAY